MSIGTITRTMFVLSALAAAVVGTPAFGQAIIGPAGSILNPEPLKDAFQIHYISNLNNGDGVVNISNSGALGADFFGGANSGNICTNVYVFSPDEQEVACCSCLITPNALVSLSAQRDLISNTLTPVVPTSIMVKLLSTIPGTSANRPGISNSTSFTGNQCNAAYPFGSNNLAPGMTAWATTLHALPTTPVTYGVSEGTFQSKYLSPGELNKMTQACALSVASGSGFGICRSCSLGGR